MKRADAIKAGVLSLTLCLLSVGSAGAADGSMVSEVRALRSRIQSMGHGYYSAEEWDEVLKLLDDVAAKASNAGDDEQVVEAALLKAMVYCDMHKNYVAALDVLDSVKTTYQDRPVANVRNLYVREAEVLSRLGDEAAIADLIKEFKEGPHFDHEGYSYKGGKGRDVPLAVVRPLPGGSDSITVTAMERYRRAAKFAPGRHCPKFTATDRQGIPLELDDYKGQVLLIDFWLSGWAPWRRNLPYLADVYRVYHPYGFEILGVALDRDTSRVNDAWIAERMIWRQVAGDQRLPAMFGVFGEASNFLIDQEGIIIARNIQGAELIQAIKEALQME